MGSSDNAEILRNTSKGKGAFWGGVAGAIALLYPPLCLSCRAEIHGEGGLCPECWRETAFITGAGCDICAAPLPGQSDGVLVCDTCLQSPPPWHQGRAAVIYDGIGRRLVLGLKHSDRLEYAKPLANWMARAAADLPTPDIVAPVPLHWTRLLRRKYNQAGVLANFVGKHLEASPLPQLLVRHRRTAQQKVMTRAERFENQSCAIALNAKYTSAIAGRHVLLIDDVLTTGATLSACTDVCLSAGAETVNILVFARVARDV